ncbi:hypothetical protein [Nocardioides currus]|uniref:Peptidase C39-like domain-containing protein n=1 Tax=Nocardioides currus TaxID=2133958 RepID=A0A2R7YTY1_9ACTN|nr:hypothetical protein [Nocardioides currus]PUA79860.1 hypothetical protein C7S10_17530 [Nocardioides currus]
MHPRPRPRVRRSAAVGIGALALLLVAVPFLPDSGRDGAGRPDLERSAGSGIAPESQAEIERVVAEGESLTVDGRSSTYALAIAATRCAVFEGQRYCLGLGWTTRTQQEAAEALAAALATDPSRAGDVEQPEQTGDLDPTTALRQRAAMSTKDRARVERAELETAARSVAKVWEIRHEIQGVPLPDDFALRHPETAIAARAKPRKHPRAFKILDERHVRPQNLTYYCGPATAQMIGWGWRERRQGQALWADKLHTSTAGTSISDMVRVVNHNTGYDNDDHAGPYVVLDIGDFTYLQWWRLMKRHIHGYKAPIVLHPILHKKFFPYLDDDASGHFQVGRGYRRTQDGSKLIGYFEPWDQSRFDPTEPRIARTQWQSAYKSFRANQAHFQHNLGV